MITSPLRRPASIAGEFISTEVRKTPFGTPSSAFAWSLTSVPWIPKNGFCWPFERISTVFFISVMPTAVRTFGAPLIVFLMSIRPSICPFRSMMMPAAEELV